MDLPANAGDIGLGELRAFVGLKPSRSIAKKLPPELRGLFYGISDVRNRLLLRVIEARSAEEFLSRTHEVFADYVRVQNAVAELSKVAMPPPLLEKMADEAFDGFDVALETQVLPRFGVAVRDQAKFTVWTIRRTLILLKRVAEAGQAAATDKDEDKRLERQFSIFLWWALFHMDCLLAAIRLNKPLRPDVVDEVVDGLRSAVNAYAIARQGLALRGGMSHRAAIAPTEWDEEDQELLDSSMAELGGNEH